MRRHMGMGRDKNYFYAFSCEKNLIDEKAYRPGQG
jgi:hypothetical protein